MKKSELKNRIFIKGFDKDLKCGEVQFEVGEEYKIDNPKGTKLELCSDTVFHFCDSLNKVHELYSCYENENNRFCIIEVLGKFIEDDNKCGSDKIKIIREITGDELKIAKGLTCGNTGLFNSGYRNSGNRNSGDQNSGYLNSGDRNIGNLNSGNRNSGSQNSGSQNSGNQNSGNRNSGDQNIGYRNSGYRNSGNLNSGIFNKTNNSNGVFCNVEPKICIFNIQTDWTLSEFYQSEFWKAICSSSFDLTEWVIDKEPKENGVDGKLVVHTYEDTCRKWWANMAKENREIIKSIPNFNIDVFCEITGIRKKEV